MTADTKSNGSNDETEQNAKVFFSFLYYPIIYVICS